MIRIVQTTKDFFWKEKEKIDLSDSYEKNTDTIFVNTDNSFQEHIGFGGAFTEAMAYTVCQVPEKTRNDIVKALFDPDEGLAYNLGRVCMNGSDFSLKYYSYVEENDSELASFDISHDDQWVIPVINQCEKAAKKDLWILISAWSAPAFMKTNRDVNHGGHIRPEYKKVWAKYFIRFIEELEKRNVRVSALTLQNEPEAVQTWASCEYSAKEEAEFLVDYLYPELKESGHSDIKIYVWDHNRDKLVRRVNEIFAYKNARKLAWGIGYHWYVSTKHENLSMAHDMFPEKHLLFTEGCVEFVGKSLADFSYAGSWENGELYGRNMINDFNNYCEGWIDWNMVLNEQGGPNYVGNYCEAPIMVDRQTMKMKKNPSYYYIGHFSRYIKPKAVRLGCKNDADQKLYSVAYRNPDGEIIAVVQNEAEERKIALVIGEKGANTILPAHSITTFRISKDL